MVCAALFLLGWVWCAAAAAAPVTEVEIMTRIQALEVKAAEVDTLKARIGQLEAQLTELRAQSDVAASHVQKVGTVREMKEDIIQYRPGEGVTMPEAGLNIQAGATFVVQGTPNANNAGDAEASRCDGSWSSDVLISKEFGDWGMAFLHLEPGQNEGIEPELAVFSNVNRDDNSTGSTVPVTELWYEQYLFDRQVTVTAGKVDPSFYLDQNEYANDETTQFLGRIFRNSPVIEWPNDNTAGARIALAPDFAKFVQFEAGYFNATADWNDLFDRPFACAQIDFNPHLLVGCDAGQWCGNWRFYWWTNALDHPKLASVESMPPDATKYANWGYGVSIDQSLTDSFGVFLRMGWEVPDLAQVSTNPNASPCYASWSGGCQLNGKLWRRDEDVIGIGIGQVFPSQYYKDAGNGGLAEGHCEVYYRYRLNKHLALSPDVQVIWNPDGLGTDGPGDTDTIFVYGLRGQVDF